MREFMRITTGLIFLTGLLAGCGKANEVASGLGGKADKEVKSLSIRSNWASQCVKSGPLVDLFSFPSQIEKYDIGASISKTTTLFREGNCQVAAISVVENGSYSLGDRVANNVYTIDMKFDSVAIIPLNQDGANTLNALKACGFNNWALGSSRDVTMQSSETPLLARCWVKTPRARYDIAEITANHLKFGLMEMGRDETAAEKRPRNLDQSLIFNKVPKLQ